MTRASRRTFLKAGAYAAGATLSASAWGRVHGSNQDLRVAVVGVSGKGKDHITRFHALPGVRVVALCDVDANALGQAAEAARKLGAKLKTFADYRQLLEQRDVDAVSIATPNHQHAVQGIWAMQAGKDVFLEKPVSHDVWEGQRLVLAAKKYPCVVQAGMQNRSSVAIRDAIAWLKEGHIGRVTVARGLCYKRRVSIGKTTGPQPVPPGVDYDRWLGPAPQAPLRRQRFHYDWHWQWATGNGDIGNQGNHQLDVARRFLGEAGLPTRVVTAGGRFGYEDDGETPNTLLSLYEYASAPLLFEVRGLPEQSGSEKMDEQRGLSVGNIIECEGGSVLVPAAEYTSAQAFDRDGRLLKEFSGKGDHYENFIRAVRSRNLKDLNAPIIEGHVSSALSHLPNISHLTGSPRGVKDALRELGSRPQLGEALGRMLQHLGANGVDLERTPLVVNASLHLDPSSERFIGDNAEPANALLRRQAREPYVIPL